MEYDVTIKEYRTDRELYNETHNKRSFSFTVTSNQETDWQLPEIIMVQCHPSFDFDRIHYTCWITLPKPYIDINVSFNGSESLLFIELKKTTLTKDEIDATMQPIEVPNV